jgi:hypothetical protein
VTVYGIREAAETYGQSVGILLLDSRLPFIPGDVGNASTYRFPVLYRTVPGLSTAACLGGAPEFADRVVAAARALEAQGVRGISSDCGFMLQYQDAVRDAVGIPVCLSSLLQLPLIARSLAPRRAIAVITADSTNLTPGFLARCGISVDNPIVISGMQDEPEFRTSVFDEKGTLDSDLVTEETVAVVKNTIAKYPEVGAVLLECSMLPPYAKAVQDAVGLPVYDFVTMIDYLHSGTHQKRHSGYY